MSSISIEFILTSIVTSIGSWLLIRYLNRKYTNRIEIIIGANQVVLEYRIAKFFFYAYLALFILISIFFAVTTSIELIGMLAFLLFGIFFSTIFILIWGNKIIYDGEKIIRIRFWFKMTVKRIQDIDNIYVTYGQSLIIKFYDGIRIKISYHHMNRQLVEWDLKEKIPHFKWSYAGRRSMARS